MKKILVLVALFTATISLNAQSLNGKTFTIQSMGPIASGRVIDADGYTLGKNGTKIQLWKMNGMAHQNWTFISANMGSDTYYIVSASPRAGIHKYLDASAISLGKNGGALQLWENNGYARGSGATPNQIFIVTKNRNGTYRIQSKDPKAKGACLDADGYTQNKNGGKVQMWQYINNLNQAWKLISSNPVSSNTLNAGKTLKAGERLTSKNGKYILQMQENDGNLCVYRFSNGKRGGFVWGSMKYGFKNARLIMQTDGNLVVYDGNNKAKWSSKTHPYNNAKFRNPSLRPVKLVLENNGKLNLYNNKNVVVWSSN